MARESGSNNRRDEGEVSDADRARDNHCKLERSGARMILSTKVFTVSRGKSYGFVYLKQRDQPTTSNITLSLIDAVANRSHFASLRLSFSASCCHPLVNCRQSWALHKPEFRFESLCPATFRLGLFSDLPCHLHRGESAPLEVSLECHHSIPRM